MRRSSNAPGFTLIELMVTVAVIAILAVVATPSFVDLFERNRVRGAADAVASLVSAARAEAVKNDLEVSIAMVGSGSDWCLGGNAATVDTPGAPAGVASACNCMPPAAGCIVSGQRLVVEHDAHPGVSASTPLATTLVFDNTLGALIPLATHALTLTSPTGKYDVRVQVSALGQARLCTPAGKPTMSDVPPC